MGVAVTKFGIKLKEQLQIKQTKSSKENKTCTLTNIIKEKNKRSNKAKT